MPGVDVVLRRTLSRARSLIAERRVRSAIEVSGRDARGAEVVIFFAEPVGQFYQLGVWLPVFERLAERGVRVGLVLMDALSARAAMARSSLPVYFSRSMQSIEQRLEQDGTRVICYVNNAQANFTMLRWAGSAHVHLNHGESEKASMVSNQLKAYDVAAVAGTAAIERIAQNIPRFELSHAVAIGRPQLDALPARPARGSKLRVLYAPTWEGDSQAMAYSSIPTHGRAILEELSGEAGIELIFRPHPKTGDVSAAVRREITQLRKEFADVLDEQSDPGVLLNAADVAICDISAMAYDALALNIPLLLVGERDCQLRRRLPAQQLLTDQMPVAATVRTLAEAGVSTQQAELASYFFASTEKGRGTELLHELLERL
ncbi:CDP-glycerol glycerophosphotransferase family protein [Glutamicibacter endophyticus]